MSVHIFDFEVFAYDWIMIAKPLKGDFRVFVNDTEAVQEFIANEHPCLGGFNTKNYDSHILKAVLLGKSREQIKALNDFIIGGGRGYDALKDYIDPKYQFDFFDLMDDMQVGLSLKSIEAHLGMDIRECSVPFDLDRPLTDDEMDEVIEYCKADVLATEKLFNLRLNYLKNKVYIGSLKGIQPEKALYMTNAKLTAAYLDANRQEHDDEREYVYPANLKREFIPDEVFEFFDRLHDKSIPDEEVFSSKLEFSIGDCECTIGFGGIHGAIPHYREKATASHRLRISPPCRI